MCGITVNNREEYSTHHLTCHTTIEPLSNSSLGHAPTAHSSTHPHTNHVSTAHSSTHPHTNHAPATTVLQQQTYAGGDNTVMILGGQRVDHTANNTGML